MQTQKITIDPTLLTYIAQTLGRVPENLYDFQKIKNLSCGGRPVYQKLVDPARDPLPERLEIVRGDFSIIGKMARLKKLCLSAMPVNDFSFLRTCIALENLEISACGVFDCDDVKEVYTLKSISLHHCPEILHLEALLKLYRLARLSLEGSRVQDVSCLKNSRIKEVYLPEGILKEAGKGNPPVSGKGGAAGNPPVSGKGSSAGNPPEKSLEAKGKGTHFQSLEGVPFREGMQDPGQRTFALTDLASPLWDAYGGAYGNVAEYVSILMGDRESAPETFKLRRLENIPKTRYETAFDNLTENLWHQMSFYPATWLALPYLAKLMEQWEREQDVKWLFNGILAAGGCLATDVFGDRPGEEELSRSYENAAWQIRLQTIRFLAKHLDYVREHGNSREFATAVMAVLGERKLSYMLFLSYLESCYLVCPACEYCDEEIEFGYFDPRERIELAEIPSEKWDGESLKDVKQWVFNLFALLGDGEGIERLRCYFGTYVCPECGKRTPVLKGMEGYFLSE